MMAMVFFVFGILAFIAFLAFLVNEMWKTSIILVFFAALLLCVPLYKNQEVISSRHVVINTDDYEGKHYSKIVRIEYDKLQYHPWAYMSGFTYGIVNFRIISDEPLIITESVDSHSHSK